jgi:hypothetical protein
MEKTKSPVASLGIWGGIGTLLVGVLIFCGVDLSEADAREAAGHFEGFLIALLGLISIIGRWRASKRVAIKPPGGRGLILAACAAICLGAAGCGATPTVRWVQAEQLLDSTQRVILAAHRYGHISDEQIVTLDPWIESAYVALELSAAHLPRGGASFDQQLDLVIEALARVAEFQRTQLRQPKGGTRGPSDRSDGRSAGDGGHQGAARGGGRDECPSGRAGARIRGVTPASGHQSRAVARGRGGCQAAAFVRGPWRGRAVARGA